MERTKQAHSPLDFNPLCDDSLRRFDEAEPETCVGRWKMPVQTIRAI